MGWYKEGKVNVVAGQTNVTGVGTNFAANSLVGDAFIGPDGQWYEVTNVPSATTLSISPAYRSATVSNANYALMPVQGYQRDLAIAAGNMLQQWGSTLAGLGTAATKNVTTTATDTTLDRLLKVGDFGLGSASAGADVSADSLTVSQFFRTFQDSSSPNARVLSGIHIQRDNLRSSDVLFDPVSNDMYWRTSGAPASRNPWLRAASHDAPFRPGQYTLTTLPSAATYMGHEIDVTNATGGSKRCRSNGAVWQILNTTTTVS